MSKSKKRTYTEIFRLRDMLDAAGVPYEWEDRWPFADEMSEDTRSIMDSMPDLMEHYQIRYPCGGTTQWISVIQGYGTYGWSDDLLEILLTAEDSPRGYLTAETVFKIIMTNWEGVRTMKKVTKVDPETLDIEIVYEEDDTVVDGMNAADLYKQILPCSTDEFGKKYMAFKKKQAEWEEIYDIFKEKVIDLHAKRDDIPKTVVVGGVKMTYVAPSTRSTIDSKKLKEEEPELAKKFTKTSNVSATLRIDKM